MEAQYYTPELHEFHYGFEYEDGFFNAHFTPKMFDFKDVEGSSKSFFIKALDNKQIRVKCLDREDIESFGFKYDSDNFFNGVFNSRLYEILLVNGNVWIYFEQSVGHDGKKEDKTLFFGKIKNKSEFRKIMVQTKILEK